jgi:hypothetical protein
LGGAVKSRWYKNDEDLSISVEFANTHGYADAVDFSITEYNPEKPVYAR